MRNRLIRSAGHSGWWHRPGLRPLAAAGPQRLRTFLVLLVVVTLAPTLGLAAFAVWQAAGSYRQASADRLVDSARVLARSVENDLVGNATLLRTLASATAADQKDGAYLQHWLDSAAPDMGRLLMFTAAGPQVIPETLTANAPPLAFIRQVMASAAPQTRPILSNLYFTGPERTAQVALAVARPVAAGQVQFFSLVLSPMQLVRLAEQAGPTATSLLVAVVDGSGRVVARSRDGQRFVGKPVPDWDKLKTLSKDKHLFEAQTAEGPSVIFAFEELADTPGWVLVVGEPLDAFNARWQHPLWQLAIGGCLALLLALLTARWVTRLILRPVRSLAHDARNVVSDDAAGTETPTRASAAGLPISEFESMRVSIVAAQAALKKRAVQERQNAQQMARSELRYRTLAHAGALVLWRARADLCLTAATGWAALTGATERQALGWRWLKRVHPDDRRALRACLGSGSGQLDLEFRVAAADGNWRWVRSRGSLVAAAEAQGLQQDEEWVGVLEDVHERRQAQDRITYMALHDALTGLPNRTALGTRLELAISRAGRGELAAVLYIDLDRFKEVNDTLGHPVGDALLRAVTQRLLLQAREVDVVARLGGDEFVVVCCDAVSLEAVAGMAARIIDAVRMPYELHGHQIVIGASIGVMPVIDGKDDPERLLKCADMALYRAKQEGRGRYYFFDQEMDARMQARKKIERQLRRAFARDEFEMSYQALIDVKSRRTSGVEAALHWNRPGQEGRGRIAFEDFSALAEEIGVAADLCAWMLNRACADLAGWQHCPKVTVKVSAAWIRRHGFAQRVARALADAGIRADRLELAVDESALLEDPQQILVALNDVCALGVRVSMDNFGATYSTVLGGLRGAPFDKVKFAHAIVRNVGLTSESDAVRRAVAKLCGSFGIMIAASGVDEEHQLAPLTTDNCIEVQGRLFGGFMTASEVAVFSAAMRVPQTGSI